MSSYLGIKSFYYLILFMISFIILYSIQSLFIPLLIAFLLANILKPVIGFFEIKGASQLSIIITIYAVTTLVFIVFFTTLTPILLRQASMLGEELPLYIDSVKESIHALENSLRSNFSFLEVPDLAMMTQTYITESIDKTTTYISNNLSSILSLFTFSLIVPFISFFILKDMYLMQKTILSYVPNRYFEMFVLLFYKVGNSIQLYIRGQLIDASFVGIMTGLGLSIIGFPYALIVGLVAGIGNFVPYFGPILGAIPAVLIIIVTPEWSTGTGISLVVAVFLIVQVIETLFVYPIAVGNSVNLHPLLIIISLLVGGEVAGIVGMIVIIPLVAILKVTFELLYKYMKEYKIIN